MNNNTIQKNLLTLAETVLTKMELIQDKQQLYLTNEMHLNNKEFVQEAALVIQKRIIDLSPYMEQCNLVANNDDKYSCLAKVYLEIDDILRIEDLVLEFFGEVEASI